MNGLVGRDQDKAFCAAGVGHTSHVERPEYVVLDRLFWSVFHQWDVLVSSGVENEMRAAHLTDPHQAIRLSDVGDLGLHLERRVRALESSSEQIQAVLINVDQGELFGRVL